MNGPFTPLPLAENKWKQLLEILEIASLPETARKQLEVTLGYGRFFVERESSDPAPHETRKRLMAMGRKADALQRDLRHFLADAEHARVHAMPLHGLIESVHTLAHYLMAAATRVPAGKKGDKTAAFHGFAKHIDTFLRKHTGKGLTRESSISEEFLGECLALIGAEEDRAESLIRGLASKRKGRQSFGQK